MWGENFSLFRDYAAGISTVVDKSYPNEPHGQSLLRLCRGLTESSEQIHRRFSAATKAVRNAKQPWKSYRIRR